MMLAVAPMKWIIYSGILAVVIDLMIIAFNLLSKYVSKCFCVNWLLD